MPEQEAFCLLVRLMNHYQLRDLFTQDMPGLHLHLYQFERLLEDIEPALYCHLHRRGISPHLYATQWFLTLFAYRFPLQLVLRIYDLILSEGLSAILRFGIALMQKNAATLLEISDMQQLTTYLKDRLFDVYIDKDPSQGSLLENGFFGSSSSTIDKEVYKADQLVRDACAVMITPELLRTYSVEWEEKTKAEKDREEELLEFRTANQKLAVCVRKLEERVEVCDREQASLATELVHTNVENEELRDENESLKGQVRELKLVIEQQPTEIEESWKLERDDLMRRNEKVHEENQKLEKELAELEEELVQTKLRYAEVSEDRKPFPSPLPLQRKKKMPLAGAGLALLAILEVAGLTELLADQLATRDVDPQMVRLETPVCLTTAAGEGGMLGPIFLAMRSAHPRGVAAGLVSFRRGERRGLLFSSFLFFSFLFIFFASVSGDSTSRRPPGPGFVSFLASLHVTQLVSGWWGRGKRFCGGSSLT